MARIGNVIQRPRIVCTASFAILDFADVVLEDRILQLKAERKWKVGVLYESTMTEFARWQIVAD
jgi:hypothetical protein